MLYQEIFKIFFYSGILNKNTWNKEVFREFFTRFEWTPCTYIYSEGEIHTPTCLCKREIAIIGTYIFGLLKLHSLCLALSLALLSLSLFPFLFPWKGLLIGRYNHKHSKASRIAWLYRGTRNFAVLPAILVPRHNLASDENTVLYNTSLEELSVSVPENTSFHATLNHQHNQQQSIPQSPQQQQQPNNPYQGMQVSSWVNYLYTNYNLKCGRLIQKWNLAIWITLYYEF